MKFRNPETGEIFEVSETKRAGEGFCLGKYCHNCPLYSQGLTSGRNCTEWIMDHPEQAALAFGYDILCPDGSYWRTRDGYMEYHMARGENLPKVEGQWEWKCRRYLELCKAAMKYIKAGKEPEVAWLEEADVLLQEILRDKP